MAIRFASIFLVLIGIGCVQEIDLPERSSDQRLIVEGFITTGPGPHSIRLSRSAKFTGIVETGGVIQTVTEASLFIRISDGEAIQLFEYGEGFYRTPEGFRAEVGNTYQLFITTLEGDNYLSLPVSVPEGPDIDDITLRFERKPSLDDFNFESGVNVFLTFDDPVGTNNFYLFNTTNGVYPWTAHPELGMDNPYNPCPPSGAEVRCFRYERDYFDPFLIQRGVFTCIVVTPAKLGFILDNDQFRDGEQITALAAFIEDDGRRFEYSYRTRINMYTIPPEANVFYERLASQLEIDGDIFDPPPAEFFGNIRSIENEEDPIGFFGAFDERSTEIYIENDILEVKQGKVRFAGDCTNLDISTLDKPANWEGSSW